jgi:hypothetical protein
MSDRLYVLWSAPDDGTRFPIGELRRTSDGYAFGYGFELEQATLRGFVLPPAFEDARPIAAPYTSAKLFPTFSERVPSPRRPDYQAIFASWGVPPAVTDPFDVLAYSGGVRLTDRLELAEYRADDDDLSTPLAFRVAGGRFKPSMVTPEIGERVSLRREVDSAHDPSATLVLMIGDVELGYVPRYYARAIARLLDARARIVAVVERHLLVPEDRGRWVVRVQAEPRAHEVAAE